MPCPKASGRRPTVHIAARSADFPKRSDANRIRSISTGATNFPFHAHSAQWEFDYVVSGTGCVRGDEGYVPIGPGDTFLCKPGEAHQLSSDAREDLVVLTVADNPIGEVVYYPDSAKWKVSIPERVVVRSEPLAYDDGEA